MARFPIVILVAEDSDPYRRSLVSMLRNGWAGQDIHAVSDGLEAVQEAQELQPT